jgi:hypothetical protein
MSNDTKKKLARMIAGRICSVNSEPIDGLRSRKGEIKGRLTNDTLYKLRRVVADHQKLEDEWTDGRLALIWGLCNAYLERHGAETDVRAKEKVASVEKIMAEAKLERGRRQAEGRYLEDAYAGAELAKAKEADPNTATPSGTALARQTEATVVVAVPQAQALAKGQLPGRPQTGFNQATLDLIRQYDLSEAEVLAVKVYTAQDYFYINPATANSRDYMVARNFPNANSHDENIQAAAQSYLSSAEGQKELKQLFEEGSLHGSMIVAALKKLPPQQGTCYRGERLTPAAFQEKYGDPTNRRLPQTTLLNLTSISREHRVAQGFADGKDCVDPNKTISVLHAVKVKAGRDVAELSLLAGENELILLPGAKLVTDTVEELQLPTDKDKLGKPPATKMVLVTAHEE